MKPRHRHMYGGLLNVINVNADPLHTYNSLRTFYPPQIEFLLPLAHWGEPPPPHRTSESATPYADWLIKIFEARRNHRNKEGVPKVRILDEIVHLIEGNPGRVEYLGLTPPKNAVIETNGEIQMVDALKSTVQGAPATGLDVLHHSFDDLLAHPKSRSRVLGGAALSGTCQQCEIVSVCGGGYQPHRYRPEGEGDGFRNPSVYCDDLQVLIRHIAQQLGYDASEALLDSLGWCLPGERCGPSDVDS